MKFEKNRIGSLAVLTFALVCCLSFSQGHADNAPASTYVGTETCRECHESQFDSFTAYAKKAASYESIKVMEKGLTEAEKKECFSCHTTGYGKAGGFISEQETPHLKNTGCEVCHGPGSLHVESQDLEDIESELTIETCQACHSSERINAFKFTPLLFGGAH